MTMDGERQLRRVLADLREISTSEHEKGGRFERLMLGFLRVAPQWATKFRHAWLWNDWPGNGGEVDTGIDLVAEHADGSGFTAIQCKFYAESTSLTLEETGTFFARSGKAPFTDRMLIATTSRWSSHLISAMENQDKPTIRLILNDLANSGVDWAAWRPDGTSPLKRRTRDPLPHQRTAINRVLAGLADHDRGKLIMACGTGKTFTSQLIAERITNGQGLVLVLLPSISLLSQTLKEWAAWSSIPMTPFAVCSDTKAGTRGDQEDISPFDLVVPATTDVRQLIANLGRAPEGHLRVIFSTYHSTPVIAEAQALGIPKFDLVICDEAHRTTGVTLVDEDDSNFTRVHDNSEISAAKRLYMTATPRIFSDGTKAKATAEDAVLASMDDELTYGPEFHRLGFRDAVDRGLLTDYKVLVLAVDEASVSTAFQDLISDENHDLRLEGAAKMVGCLNALTKRDANGQTFSPTDQIPMQTALAFNTTIAQSKEFKELLSEVADRFDTVVDDVDVVVEIDHVDGGHNSLQRECKLSWLSEDVGEERIRILSNARCLTEGVDVPALDAVIFLEPRNSMVDVIQAVGRVMRRDPSGRKKLGYVILPIGIPASISPEEALSDNKTYKVVWQVLNALRSHDERLNAVVNQLDVNNEPPEMIAVQPGGIGAAQTLDTGDEAADEEVRQLTLAFPIGQVTDAIYAQLVKKVGTRHYWEDWAADIAAIAARHETRIRSLLEDPSLDVAKEFERFVRALRSNLNDSITVDDAVGMLSQHLITRPVFEALFEEYDFIGSNPVSVVMQGMIDRLDQHSLDKEAHTLRSFYRDVRIRAEGIDNAEGKQRIITELYERFFAKALPKTAAQLGIVYTPIEVVDFIIHATNDALRKHLGCSLTDEGVHILDPFVGTGTFIVRLLQSGLISPHDLARKYVTEIHANDILLLVYYIAAINIEATYHDLTTGDGHGPYQSFPGIVLTDTFQFSDSDPGRNIDLFGSNNRRADRQAALPIRVIFGNPPYSEGAKKAHDDQNLKYPALDQRIAQTYVDRSTAQRKSSLYNSYVRAIRWASDRVIDNKAGGVVAYVSNGGYIDSNVADGLRLSLADEFHHVYVYNLRGNQRTSGELSRKEGGKIFGQGSRATIAILIAVREPTRVTESTLYYKDIGDYLTRAQKLVQLRLDSAAGSPLNAVMWNKLIPNSYGDWINQRSDHPHHDLLPLLEEDDSENIFLLRTSGLKTNRDAWNYNSSRLVLETNACRMVESFNAEVDRFKRDHVSLAGTMRSKVKIARGFVDFDDTKFKWDRSDFKRMVRGDRLSIDHESFFEGAYRPFEKRHVNVKSELNNTVYQTPKIYPTSTSRTPAIVVSGMGGSNPFSCMIVDHIPDTVMMGAGNAVTVYALMAQSNMSNRLELFDDLLRSGSGLQSNISPRAVKRYQEIDSAITDEDLFFHIYGLLHSPDYRKTFAADLKKSLPRIPLVKEVDRFWAFSKAGRALADLHLNYEGVDPWPSLNVTLAEGFDRESPASWRIEKMRYPKVTDPKTKKKVDDKTTVIVNSRITVGGIPGRAHDYMLGSRSAIDWILNQYRVKTHKESGITNDPNDWAAEHDRPSYIFDLLCSVVTVSMKTLDIIDSLPEIPGLDRDGG
jgi:predicted helicase